MAERATHCRRGHEYNEINTSYSSTRSRECRICRAIRKQAWRALRSTEQRDDSRKYDQERNRRKYGISHDEYWVMRLEQRDCCLICGDKFMKSPHIDHDHNTDTVRALLCGLCNVGLGAFRDRPALLQSAADYVQYFAVEVVL